jgi:hypothetical protein
MSQENVEAMRESYEMLNLALASGEDLRPLMDGLDPEFVLEMGVLEGTFHGREGFARFLEGQVELFEELRCDPEESSTLATRSSFRCASAVRQGARASSLSITRSTYGPCATGSRRVYGSTRAGTGPSKPWGCGSSNGWPTPA